LVVNARQFRNVIRNLAAVGPLGHLVGDLLDNGFEVGGGVVFHRMPYATNAPLLNLSPPFCGERSDCASNPGAGRDNKVKRTRPLGSRRMLSIESEERSDRLRFGETRCLASHANSSLRAGLHLSPPKI